MRSASAIIRFVGLFSGYMRYALLRLTQWPIREWTVNAEDRLVLTQYLCSQSFGSDHPRYWRYCFFSNYLMNDIVEQKQTYKQKKKNNKNIAFELNIWLNSQFRVSYIYVYLFKFLRVCIDMYLILLVYFRVYLIISN